MCRTLTRYLVYTFYLVSLHCLSLSVWLHTPASGHRIPANPAVSQNKVKRGYEAGTKAQSCREGPRINICLCISHTVWRLHGSPAGNTEETLVWGPCFRVSFSSMIPQKGMGQSLQRHILGDQCFSQLAYLAAFLNISQPQSTPKAQNRIISNQM